MKPGPLAMLEAAVAGVPTVGTAVGHIREWSPAAAACVPVGDWARLGESISQLLQDEDLRLRIAREALQQGRTRRCRLYGRMLSEAVRDAWSKSRQPPA